MGINAWDNKKEIQLFRLSEKANWMPKASWKNYLNEKELTFPTCFCISIFLLGGWGGGERGSSGGQQYLLTILTENTKKYMRHSSCNAVLSSLNNYPVLNVKSKPHGFWNYSKEGEKRRHREQDQLWMLVLDVLANSFTCDEK